MQNAELDPRPTFSGRHDLELGRAWHEPNVVSAAQAELHNLAPCRPHAEYRELHDTRLHIVIPYLEPMQLIYNKIILALLR